MNLGLIFARDRADVTLVSTCSQIVCQWFLQEERFVWAILRPRPSWVETLTTGKGPCNSISAIMCADGTIVGKAALKNILNPDVSATLCGCDSQSSEEGAALICVLEARHIGW